MAPPKAKKKPQGRKKIEIKLIEDKSARIACFSKRRAGIFKKAAELSVLCGAQIALIIFTLSGRAYTFGHPNPESVVHRFLNRIPNPDLTRRFHSVTPAQLMEQCDEKAKELKAKKRKVKELEVALESSGQITDELLDQMDMNQLQDLKLRLEKFRDDMMASMQLGSAGTSSSSMNVDILSIPKEVSTSSSSMNVDILSIPKEVNLANVERDGCRTSPIPADWLKM